MLTFRSIYNTNVVSPAPIDINIGFKSLLFFLNINNVIFA